MTTTTNKVLPVALVAALLGGTVGAFVMRDGKKTPEVAVASQQARANDDAATADANKAEDPNALLNQEIADETRNMTDEERTAFRAGFDEGVQAARENELSGTTAARNATASNVVYRPATRTRTRTVRQAPRRVYYDYGQTKGRSFWQKHRDKLTVAGGTGVGAIVGGLIGGKKGAAIGALSGAGGSALYTYKLRKRNRNY